MSANLTTSRIKRWPEFASSGPRTSGIRACLLHAVIRDYTAYGIGNDDPDVVKGRAGSPYAVKDYYDVNPDLAVDPARRLEEFAALVDRTHANGMKVIIDIVPNHVARGYRSLSRPEGVADFGASDDTSVEWARDNNFYYVPGEDFEVPSSPGDYRPLGGEAHPLSDGQFPESPAKWTGNGSRAAQPRFDDWFETVKVNYGVRPDGSYAFDRLPDEARRWTTAEHAAFWSDKDVPDSWIKFRDIALYWIAKGVDGFRYDMAEMVPVEFWSYLNASIKMQNSDAFLLAEVYNPTEYRELPAARSYGLPVRQGRPVRHAETDHAGQAKHGRHRADPCRGTRHRAAHAALPREPRRAAHCECGLRRRRRQGKSRNGRVGTDQPCTDDAVLRARRSANPATAMRALATRPAPPSSTTGACPLTSAG